MISYLLVRMIRRIDNEFVWGIQLGQVFCMAITELFLYLIYIDFGLNHMNISSMVMNFNALLFAVYANITVYIDWYTGYVYSLVNLISFVCILGNSCVFVGISPDFIVLFIIYAGIIFICEKINAFCRGDTEFLIILYWYFNGMDEGDFAIRAMFVTMLVSALLFDVFRRITGRKEEMLPYTPFIVLSEFIYLLILSWV